jgi:hypothetical protein
VSCCCRRPLVVPSTSAAHHGCRATEGDLGCVEVQGIPSEVQQFAGSGGATW